MISLAKLLLKLAELLQALLTLWSGFGIFSIPSICLPIGKSTRS